jgi:hypothetical protein
MKNVHLIPTDKPSKLRYNLSNVLVITKELYRDYGKEANQHVYLTSENEDINENDHIITKDGRLVKVSYLFSKDLAGASKVVLADDPDLIKDGVQAIDDEFLEWFVKNPSCEEVEVKKGCKIGCDKFILNGVNSICCEDKEYKIIIPQEEPKPHSFCETPEEKCTMNYCDENGCQNRVRHLVEPQEELKQDLEKEMFELEQELDIPSNLRWHNSKPKQEIIATEEDAKIFLDTIENPLAPNEKLKTAFIKHEFRAIPKEEVLANRCNAYEFIDFDKKETLEDKLKSLVKEWQERQWKYEDVAQTAKDEHNDRKFTYKAMATRDCWKELLKLIEDEK